MVRYAFLRDALIRRLFLVDTLSNIEEAALINFFVLLYISLTYHNVFYLGLNIAVPVGVQQLTYVVSNWIDRSNKKM
jgi:hypothetical protein